MALLDKLDLDGQQGLAMVFFGIIAALILTILGFLIFEGSPLQYKNSPFPMAADEYYGGQIPVYYAERCNNTGETIVYEVTQRLQSLEDEYTMTLGTSKILLNPGCTSAAVWLANLPDDMIPGAYRIVGVSEVNGRLRSHFVEWSTQPFIVLQKD